MKNEIELEATLDQKEEERLCLRSEIREILKNINMYSDELERKDDPEDDRNHWENRLAEANKDYLETKRLLNTLEKEIKGLWLRLYGEK